MVIDGKHITIKGKKYCIYLAFDTKIGLIGHYLRRGGEAAWGYHQLFNLLFKANYEPWSVVSDGGPGIPSVLKKYGIVRHQRCVIHLLRDLRVGLRMCSKKMKFVLRKYYLYQYAKLLLNAVSEEQKTSRLKHFRRVVEVMWPIQGQVEKNTVKALLKSLPLAYTWLEYDGIFLIPKTTNLIEGYISHLNTRLKTMRGLKSSANAELTLNGIIYCLRKKTI